MSEISPWETLYLWHLIGRRGTAPWKERPASIDAKYRRALEKRGLIEVSKGARNSLVAEVTDEGWAWAADHLRSKLPNSQAAAPVLSDWMAVVSDYLETHRLALADLFVEPERADTQTDSSTETDLLERIRRAYLKQTDGRWRTEVRISKLKALFDKGEHAKVDEALISLARRGDAELLPIDDPLRLNIEDKAAALTIAGEQRHLVFLNPERS